MKTKIIIVACIIVAFAFVGCTTKNNFDLKVTVIPQENNSVTTPGDVNKAAEVITRRLINFFSIPQENIKTDITENKISLTLSKIDTGKIGQIKKVITGYARLEFWETYENSEIIGYLTKANNKLKEMQPAAAGPKTATTAEADTIEEFKNHNPLFGILRPMINPMGEPLPSCMIGVVSANDTSKVDTYLKMDQITALFPGDIKFFWSANPYKYDTSKLFYELHAIKVTTGNKKAPLDGSSIISAKATEDPHGAGVRLGLTMDSAGARTWAVITRDNINRCIAVVINGYVRSYPRVMTVISGGNSEISGNFTIEEASDFANILKSGELPYKVKIVDSQILSR